MILLLLLLSLVSLNCVQSISAQSPSPAPLSESSPAETATVDPDLDVDAVEAAIISRTNEFRGENDLPPLATDMILNRTAEKFAQFMAEEDKYGHRADGRTPAERAVAEGYEYCAVRENIAFRMNTAGADVPTLSEFFVQGWIDSPPHRENMLADFATQTGVAVSTIDGITFYGVQVFGRPKSASISISLKNADDSAITLVTRSEAGTDEIQVPAGATVKMNRCFPTTLEIGGEKIERVVNESSELVFDGDGLTNSGEQLKSTESRK